MGAVLSQNNLPITCFFYTKKNVSKNAEAIYLYLRAFCYYKRDELVQAFFVRKQINHLNRSKIFKMLVLSSNSNPLSVALAAKIVGL